MNHTNTLAIPFATIAAIMLIIGGSIIHDHGVFALRYGKNTSDNWSLQQIRSNGISLGITSGGGPSYDISTQAKDDGSTLAKDNAGIQGAGSDNQETQQGDHNFNNQQYRSIYICLMLCK